MKLFLLCMLVGAVTAFAPLLKVQEPIPEQYIVKLKGDADLQSVIDKVKLHEIFDSRVKIRDTFEHVFKGFSARLTDGLVSMVRSLDAVEYIEQDGIMRKADIASWGLDRIDQFNSTLDDNYEPMNNGSSAHVYVLDTGITPTHEDFGDRAEAAYNAIDDGRTAEDCDGHGTHCAGTVAGTKYGVAKLAKVYGVRVLNCQGSGSTSDIVEAENWVIANHNHPAVASMSLGGGASQASDDGVMGMINAGIPVAVAAGNEDTFAGTKSPARTRAAVTVGATDSADTRASFSNYGACVDIFAPGVSITSARHNSYNGTETWSGTSMATPHVAGALAMMRAANATRTPAELKELLQEKSMNDKITSAEAYSPNLLLYVGQGKGGGSVPSEYGANTACGDTITTDGTKITPDGFPYFTKDDQDCSYLITAPEGKRAKVTFNYFAVEPKRLSGCWDQLHVYDGTSSSANLLGSHCGTTIIGPFTSTGTSLYLHFVTDVTVGYPGFEAVVTFVE